MHKYLIDPSNVRLRYVKEAKCHELVHQTTHLHEILHIDFVTQRTGSCLQMTGSQSPSRYLTTFCPQIHMKIDEINSNLHCELQVGNFYSQL